MVVALQVRLRFPPRRKVAVAGRAETVGAALTVTTSLLLVALVTVVPLVLVTAQA